MTLGLAIPVTKNYINDLEMLLENISKQTVKPDEISISISEVDEYYPKNDYGLNLIITTHTGKKNGATNRNIAAKKLTTDLISFFDCDDLMHIKRTEFIKNVFENNQDVKILVHDFLVSKDTSFKPFELTSTEFINYDYDNLTLIKNNINTINKNHLYPIDFEDKMSYHNAHVTILKEILEVVVYNEEHPFPDSLFNRELVEKGYKISIILNKLSYYNLK